MADELVSVLLLLLKIWSVYFALVALFTLKKPKTYPAAPPVTRFAVISAARNEEAVIHQLVESVLGQDYPVHLRDMYVLPNHCTDATADAARRAGAQVIPCPDHICSKGAALHLAMEVLADKGYDAFLVFDADNTLAPDYLARMNDAVCAGAQVFKSRTRAANPTASGIAGCYGLYNTICDLAWSRPRANCGLSAKLFGTGFGFTRQVLETVGGWNTSAIAEDCEFAAQCAEHGFRVQWVPNAVNYDEEPLDLLTSLRQRKRWCSGIMQVAGKKLPALWRSRRPRPLLRVDMTMFLLAPFAQALSGFLLLWNTAAQILTGDGAALRFAALTLAAGWLGCTALAAVLCLLGRYPLRRMGRTVVLFPIFMATWLPLQMLALLKPTRKWHPIVHHGCGDAAKYGV